MVSKKAFNQAIAQTEIEDKVKELCELIRKFKGSRSDTALHACFEVVTTASDSHFEGVGILAECMMAWRKASDEVLKEERE